MLQQRRWQNILSYIYQFTSYHYRSPTSTQRDAERKPKAETITKLWAKRCQATEVILIWNKDLSWWEKEKSLAKIKTWGDARQLFHRRRSAEAFNGYMTVKTWFVFVWVTRQYKCRHLTDNENTRRHLKMKKDPFISTGCAAQPAERNVEQM